MVLSVPTRGGSARLGGEGATRSCRLRRRGRQRSDSRRARLPARAPCAVCRGALRSLDRQPIRPNRPSGDVLCRSPGSHPGRHSRRALGRSAPAGARPRLTELTTSPARRGWSYAARSSSCRVSPCGFAGVLSNRPPAARCATRSTATNKPTATIDTIRLSSALEIIVITP